MICGRPVPRASRCPVPRSRSAFRAPPRGTPPPHLRLHPHALPPLHPRPPLRLTRCPIGCRGARLRGAFPQRMVLPDRAVIRRPCHRCSREGGAPTGTGAVPGGRDVNSATETYLPIGTLAWLNTAARSPAEVVHCPTSRWRTHYTGAGAPEQDRRAFLRRFDIEHTFRLFKQTLGWTKPRLRSSEAADRWTWLVIAAYAQLRLARPLATDLRRSWEKPTEPNRLTPARVRRVFRNLHAKTGSPAGAPKPSRLAQAGRQARRTSGRSTRHDVGRVLATGEAFSRPAHHEVGTKPRRGAPEVLPA